MSEQKVQYQWVWVIITVAFTVFTLGFTTNAGGDRLRTLSDVIKKVMVQEITIKSEAQFEQFIECVQLGVKGCDRIERKKGMWKELEDTIMEDCPCGGEDMDGTEFLVKFKLKDKEKITLPEENFGGMDTVKEWKSSLWNIMSTAKCRENPVLKTDSPTDVFNLKDTEKDIIFVKDADGITIHNNSRATITPDQIHTMESSGAVSTGVAGGAILGCAVGPFGCVLGGAIGSSIGGIAGHFYNQPAQMSATESHSICVDVSKPEGEAS